MQVAVDDTPFIHPTAPPDEEPAVEPPPQDFPRQRRGVERPAVVHATREELSELAARITQTVVEQLQKPMATSKYGRKLHIKPCEFFKPTTAEQSWEMCTVCMDKLIGRIVAHGP
eukprot:7259631-Alexandrium_andersonii.AAC.1